MSIKAARIRATVEIGKATEAELINRKRYGQRLEPLRAEDDDLTKSEDSASVMDPLIVYQNPLYNRAFESHIDVGQSINERYGASDPAIRRTPLCKRLYSGPLCR